MTDTDMYTSSDKINSSLFVFICVALSVLEIIGGAYFMGLTIEIVTSIVLILRYKSIPDICYGSHGNTRVNFFGRCKFLQI